jgi:hypothetical protein
LLPGTDIFECFGAVKLFQRIVDRDFEAVAGELQQVVWRKAGGIREQVGIERGVIPPTGGDFADWSGHELLIATKRREKTQKISGDLIE